jgi:hypothetical protein
MGVNAASASSLALAGSLEDCDFKAKPGGYPVAPPLASWSLGDFQTPAHAQGGSATRFVPE